MGYNVAIDGPAGAEKARIAEAAKEKGYITWNTGAMYRGLAIHFLDKGIQPQETESDRSMQDAEVTIAYEDAVQHVYLNGKGYFITSEMKRWEIWHL